MKRDCGLLKSQNKNAENKVTTSGKYFFREIEHKTNDLLVILSLSCFQCKQPYCIKGAFDMAVRCEFISVLKLNCILNLYEIVLKIH